MSGRYWDHNCPFEVQLVNENDFRHDKIVGEWLHLPTTSEKLRELLQIINGDRDGWTIGDVDAHIYGIEDALRECTDLNELNYLASRIEDLDDDELEQFRVVIETEQHCDSVMELINLCSNLDCYEIQADISDYDDLGRWDLMERSTFLRSTVEALESICFIAEPFITTSRKSQLPKCPSVMRKNRLDCLSGSKFSARNWIN